MGLMNNENIVLLRASYHTMPATADNSFRILPLRNTAARGLAVFGRNLGLCAFATSPLSASDLFEPHQQISATFFRDNTQNNDVADRSRSGKILRSGRNPFGFPQTELRILV